MKNPRFQWLAVLLMLFSSCQLPFDILTSENESVAPAQESYELALDDNGKAAALYGLGRSYYTEKNYAAAIDAFNRILGQYPGSGVTAEAYFMVAECYFDIDEYQLAADSYAKYVQLNPGVIDNYALTLAGDASFDAGNFSQAIYHYQTAQQADPPGNASYINLQIGKSYEGLEDFTTAIQYYMTTHETAEEDYSKSTANLLAGQAYLKLELEEKANYRLMESVIQFPTTYDSYTALTILINNGVEVNDFYRGLVDYYYARDYDPTVFDFAIQAFDRYITSNPDNNDGSVYYFKGLSHYYNDEPRDAVREYDTLIQNFPGNPYWPAAWDEKAYVQWAVLEEYTNAAETYLAFVSTTPTSPEAAQYLYEAGRVFERSGNLESAAATWQRLMNEYPSDEISYRGLFMAGISYFRLSQYEEALSIFQRSLVLGTNPAERAKSYLWIGKCHQSLGNEEDAANAWDLGKLADPTDYYSIRSGQLQDGIEPYTIEEGYDLGYALELERPEAEVWLISTFSLDPGLDLSTLGEVAENIHIKRLEAFWNLGLIDEANREANLLRAEFQLDIVQSYSLMNHLLSLHLYQPAIYICRNILDMAGMDDLSSLSAPIFFTHVRFGAYFREMLVPISIEYDLHPLILYSLVRLESLFNPYIGSSAGAIGLAQLLPSTGKENADILSWPPNYSEDDLLKAEINLSLGAFYLKRLKDGFNGNLQYALAAYNGGIYFVSFSDQNWIDKSQGDPDLFLEVIPENKKETQDYLKIITEFLNIYQLVYSRPQ
jgi:soluble lytic murein transglycosylase